MDGPEAAANVFPVRSASLGELARAAWEAIIEVYRTLLGRDDVLPGAIAGIQTFGELAHYQGATQHKGFGSRRI